MPKNLYPKKINVKSENEEQEVYVLTLKHWTETDKVYDWIVKKSKKHLSFFKRFFCLGRYLWNIYIYIYIYPEKLSGLALKSGWVSAWSTP